jgi:hypothetical protein
MEWLAARVGAPRPVWFQALGGANLNTPEIQRMNLRSGTQGEATPKIRAVAVSLSVKIEALELWSCPWNFPYNNVM